MTALVRVQTGDFDIGAEITALRTGKPKIGAVASFIGTVRDLNEGSDVGTLTLEHYPGMTEAALNEISAQAAARWQLIDTLVIHRYGTLQPLDQIVLVVVTSMHREDALQACAFIMDYLKTRAPFWKKETTVQGTRWVEARESDEEALSRWEGNDQSMKGSQ